LLQNRLDRIQEAFVLVRDDRVDPCIDRIELLGDRRTAGVWRIDPLGLLQLQTADSNHEKLVHVARRYRQELEPFEHGHLGVLSLIQNALVEFQPTEFTVDVVVWI